MSDELTPGKPGYCVCGRVLFITSTGPGCLNPRCARNVRASLYDAAHTRSQPKKKAKKPPEPKALYGADHL